MKDELRKNQDVQFDQNMAIATLFGNITHWRTNFRNNAAQMPKVLAGRMKILNLIDRFQVKK